MDRKEYPRSAPCPCGSGKTYELCCLAKGIVYVQAEDGEVAKSVPVDAEVREALDEQRRRFVEEFGREPGPDDKVFFDAPPLEHFEAEIVKAMEAAGVNPAVIYAYQRTGLIVSEKNQHLIPDADLVEWQAGIEEYSRLHEDDGDDLF
jgi:hypothetical protein